MHKVIAHPRKLTDAQQGINMVDLMMWIVIAALLLAAAIQGIGYYQKAAYLYQMQNDADHAGTLANAYAAQQKGVIDDAVVASAVADSSVSTDIVSLADGGTHPYVRVTHPGVDDKDVLYLFDECGEDYKIGVNVVPKGGTPALAACGITGTGGTGSGSTGSGGTTTTPPAVAVDYTYSGLLAGWGRGAEGNLANGVSTWMNYPAFYSGPGIKEYSPNAKLGGQTVTAMDVGLDHGCATANGTTYCWGHNWAGELGGGTVDPNWWRSFPTPQAVVMDGDLAGKSFDQLTTSDASLTCGLISSTAYCWGSNTYGQTGTGLPDDHLERPTKVAGPLLGKPVTQIISRGYGQSACAISEGSVYCWGYNEYGQLGNGSGGSGTYNPTPTKVGGALEGKTVTRLAMSSNYGETCAIADGQAYCWGLNQYGELGAGMTPAGQVGPDGYNYVPTPVAVTTDTFPANAVVTDIALGVNQGCAIVSGKAYCWGNYNNYFSDYGQLGRGTPVDGETPLPKPVVTAGTPMDGKTLTKIFAGDSVSYAISDDNQLYGWGGSWVGQLGTSTDDQHVPVLVNHGILSGQQVTGLTVGYSTIFTTYK